MPAYLKEMDCNALSPTALALSTSAVCSKKAMYWTHRAELFGQDTTSLSKSSTFSGAREVSERALSVCGQEHHLKLTGREVKGENGTHQVQLLLFSFLSRFLLPP